MLQIIWEFVVRRDASAEFERIYGPEGEWARLFHRAPGYIRTDLLRDQETPGRYVTIDVWQAREDFSRFQQQFADEYHRLDARCEGLTTSEKLVGRFSEVSAT
jgi:heme-degrading monooxygenase HmoA